MKLPISVCVVVAILSVSGCTHGGQSVQPQKRLGQQEYVQGLMGVQVRLVLYTTDEVAARTAAKAAFARVAELEAVMSDYQRDSELMQLCDKAGTGPVRVSKDLFDVLAYA